LIAASFNFLAMLSILVPTYNFDIRDLVKALHNQCKKAGIDFEILCHDDGSTDDSTSINKSVSQLENVVWVENKVNRGRAAIRNQMANQVKFPYLLFLDCDSKIVRDEYIEAYIEQIPTSAVLVGGRVYLEEKPSLPELHLHWLYGRRREQGKHIGFHSNNFLISKASFHQTNFDESIKDYGHEDTLFGFELERQGIPVEYLDNPTLHLGLEDAPIFLQKQEAAINNLINLEVYQPGIRTRLRSTAKFLSALGLNGILVKVFRSKRDFLRKKLFGPHPSLFILDLYKIGYYLSARLPK